VQPTPAGARAPYASWSQGARLAPERCWSATDGSSSRTRLAIHPVSWRASCGAGRLLATRHRGRRRGLALDPDRSHPGQHIDIAMGNEGVRLGPLYRCIDKQLKVDRGESSCLEGDLTLY